MSSDFLHKILIVEPDKKLKARIASILELKKFTPVYAANGPDALEEIKNSKTAFSLIIAAQTLDKTMNGSEFLEQAKEVSPHTIRFLMTASSDVQATIAAVNKGAIQRCLMKPWDDEDFLLAVETGIEYFNSYLDHKKLLTLAKKQNTNLYELNCELMETGKAHNEEIKKLENQILEIKEQINAAGESPENDMKDLPRQIGNFIDSENGPDTKRIQELYKATLRSMFAQFDELAQRKGFDMPAIKGLRE